MTRINPKGKALTLEAMVQLCRNWQECNQSEQEAIQALSAALNPSPESKTETKADARASGTWQGTGMDGDRANVSLSWLD